MHVHQTFIQICTSFNHSNQYIYGFYFHIFFKMKKSLIIFGLTLEIRNIVHLMQLRFTTNHRQCSVVGTYGDIGTTKILKMLRLLNLKGYFQFCPIFNTVNENTFQFAYSNLINFIKLYFRCTVIRLLATKESIGLCFSHRYFYIFENFVPNKVLGIPSALVWQSLCKSRH